MENYVGQYCGQRKNMRAGWGYILHLTRHAIENLGKLFLALMEVFFLIPFQNAITNCQRIYDQVGTNFY